MSLKPDNQIIEGFFTYGKLQRCKAKILYPNGEYYYGMVTLNGVKDGQGLYYYANGDIYDGKFVKNKRIGKASLKFNDGSEYIGQFINDQADGHGLFTDTHGSRYQSIVEDKVLK